MFTRQLQTQKQELVAMLETCNNFAECSTKDGIVTIERTFNQIILHFKRLAKQWKTVLPDNIFNNSLAVLINTVLENILTSVFRMEDISAEDGGQLHAVLGILIEHIPEIIRNEDADALKDEKNEKSFCDRVRSWLKFNYLRTLLDSSLLEIGNLWDNGEGELAQCMNEGEVRGLIRALFQNTDQRSKVLAKIKQKSDQTSGSM